MTAVNNWTNVTDFTGILNVVNDNSGGYFWVGTLVMIFAVMTISLIGFGIIPAVMTAGFVCLLLALLLFYMGVLNGIYLMFFAGGLLFLFLYIVYTSQKQDF